MDIEKVVVSAEDMSVVIYAEVSGIILGIRLDRDVAERIADDIRDRVAIILRSLEKRPAQPRI